MQPKNTLFTLASLVLPLLTPVTASFLLYTGQDNYWTPDGQVVAPTCRFFHSHPSCKDVFNSVSGTLYDSGGDLSGSGRGCICEGPGDACTGAPHKIKRLEIHIKEIGHYTIYPKPGGKWELRSTSNKVVGHCTATREDNYQCSQAISSHGGGSIFRCDTDIW